jgi:hypothetical protein
MSTQLYTVTLNDLGSYRITVAADTPSEAASIAKTVLHEEMTHLPDGATIVKRETEAKAEIADEQPLRTFTVNGIYQLDFSLTVPATTRAEAERHARRLYEVNGGPFEFCHDGGDVVRLVAEEVAS